MPDGRILCLDVGDARIGVAVSDPTGVLAQPVCTLVRKNRDDDIARIRALAEENGASRIVSGLPRLLDGSEGEQAAKTRSFVARCARACSVPADFWDERFSTSAARRVLVSGGATRDKQKKSIDMLAAVVILQNYLDAGRGKASID